MKTTAALGKFVPGILGLLAFAAWYYAIKGPSQSRVYSTECLRTHWCAIFAYFGVLYGLAFLALVIGFRNRLDILSIIFGSLKVATAWLLVSLYFITSDPYAQPVLTHIGLGESKWLFLVGSIIWSVVAFLQFAREIDASKRKING